MVQLHAQTTIAIFSVVSIGAFAYWYYTRPNDNKQIDTETKKED